MSAWFTLAHGWDGVSRIKPHLAPRRAGRVAAELHPVVQPERPVLPELDLHRLQPVAGPVRRPRDGSHYELGGDERDRLLESVAALERRRLLAGPGADLGEARAGGEIGVGLRVGDALDRAAQPHLPVQ